MKEGKTVGIISSGKIWPYAISASIIMVFGFCVATIIITQQRPVEKSDTYMMDYNYADVQANKLIEQDIAFNKKYKVSYITEVLTQENTILKYKVTDINDNFINNAKILAIITRPNNHKNDQELINPSIDNGIYTFKAVTLAQPGRWNVIARISIGKNEKFYSVKADTRAKEAFEY